MYINDAVYHEVGHNWSYGVFYNDNDHRILIFSIDEEVNLWGNPFVR